MKIFKLFVLSCFLQTATAQAAVLCQFAAYEPDALLQVITRRLNTLGIAAVSSTQLGQRTKSDATMFGRDGRVFGFMSMQENVRLGSKELVLFDSAHEKLATATETLEPCYRGLCRRASMTIYLGQETATVAVTQDPVRGMTFLVGDDIPENVTLWRSQLDDYLDWSVDNLSNSRASVPLFPISRLDSLNILLTLDPDIYPYLGLLTLHMDPQGRIILSGRTNINIYNLILSKAIAAGFYGIIPDVIIDSGVILYGPDQTTDLQRCL